MKLDTDKEITDQDKLKAEEKVFKNEKIVQFLKEHAMEPFSADFVE